MTHAERITVAGYANRLTEIAKQLSVSSGKEIVFESASRSIEGLFRYADEGTALARVQICGEDKRRTAVHVYGSLVPAEQRIFEMFLRPTRVVFPEETAAAAE